MTVDIVILAAGKGTRMRSRLPKVLQKLAGKPLLSHVLDTAGQIENSRLHVVTGHGADKVQQAFPDYNINWILQTEQLGTGHAVMQALPSLAAEGKTLILYGDVPLVTGPSLQTLLAETTATRLALLTVKLANPHGYGRILRNNNGAVTGIVEEKDASEQQKTIAECNSGIMAVDNTVLAKLLPKIGNQNAQQEYYLTDLVELAVADGLQVSGICTVSEMEVQGVNDRKQLAALERSWQQLQAGRLMEMGVNLLDPARIDIRGKLVCGQDVSIDINCIFQGEVSIGHNVEIGANCIIGEAGSRVVIGDNVVIKPNSIIEQGVIGDDCVLGPFARLRPGTELASGVKIGNFVETKNSQIGRGSKVNHLSYIGDAEIGENVNVGAGTITCNYDGVNKHRTVIRDEAFIGSNTSLVAPVTIGFKATVGAGSTVNRDVDNEELAVARANQKNIKGWPRPKKK